MGGHGATLTPQVRPWEGREGEKEEGEGGIAEAES